MSEISQLQTHFDCIIVGTGLRESILAAYGPNTTGCLTYTYHRALAKSGRTVLHVDENTYYGGRQATLSLKEFREWTHSDHKTAYRNIETEFPASGCEEMPGDLLQASRHYNISLCSTLVCAKSAFVDALVRSGVATYTGFKLLDSIAQYHQGQWRRAAATKEDIFGDKSLSLIEKRKVMKFLLHAAGEFEESDLYKENCNISLKSYLEQSFSLDGVLRDMILYTAALSSTPDDTVSRALPRLKKYMHSSGRYGKSPFLLAQHGGIGEIVQGFCRICAVFGGTYMLGRPISKLTPAGKNSPASIEIDGHECYTGDYLVHTVLNGQENSVHRGLAITSAPIAFQIPSTPVDPDGPENDDPEGSFAQAQNALFVIPPDSLDGSSPSTPVTALLTGEGTFATPAGKYVLSISRRAADAVSTARSALEPSVNALLSRAELASGTSAVDALVYWTEQEEGPLSISAATDETSHLDEDVQAVQSLAEICDEALVEAQRAFTKITGEAELFEAVATDSNQNDEE